VMADEARNVWVVFNDDNAGFHGSIVNGKQWPVASCQWLEAGSGV
jgi:hypothetical protein